MSGVDGLVPVKGLRMNHFLFALLFLEFMDIFFQQHVELKKLFVT